jgi:K(+)-stimulated pyrophosphate-energized sodium pump
VLPGLYAVLSPITVGFLVGPKCLVGMLAGAIASGMMLAIMMANAGGAWDNAKKYIEIEGACGGKGTETHKACVVGDTVGDPFKDTSGPALNILIKLMSIIALTIAPLLAGDDDWEVWYYGLIPLGVMLIGTYLVYYFFWREIADITADVSSNRVDTENPGKADPVKDNVEATPDVDAEEVESA